MVGRKPSCHMNLFPAPKPSQMHHSLGAKVQMPSPRSLSGHAWPALHSWTTATPLVTRPLPASPSPHLFIIPRFSCHTKTSSSPQPPIPKIPSPAAAGFREGREGELAPPRTKNGTLVTLFCASTCHHRVLLTRKLAKHLDQLT
jgi:hypothetical protein